MNTGKETITKLMIGTCLSNKGGITSVVALYYDMGIMDKTLYLASSKDGDGLAKIIMFAGFLWRLTITLLQHRELETVHIHVSQRGSVVRKTVVTVICRLLGLNQLRVFWHMHGSEFVDWFNQSSQWSQNLITWSVNQAHCLIALSEKRKQDLLAIIPTANVTVVYNPCKLQSQKQLSCFNGKERTSKQQSVHFLFMGRYGQRKGVFDLIEAVKQANNKHIKLSLYGDAAIYEVQALVNQYQLSDQIQVGQWIAGKEKHQVFLEADALVLPSYNEGLPMAILEALSYGLPVISTPVGGIAEAVQNNQNGFLIQPGDIDALAETLLFFVNNPARIKEMGQAGYQLAQKQFDSQIIAQKLKAVYQQ